MAVTVIGRSTSTANQGSVSAPLVEIKPVWNAPWTFTPDLELVRASAVSASHGLGSCELRRRYGAGVKQPYQASLKVVDPVDYLGYWVRITMYTTLGPAVVWVGRISSEPRTVAGSATQATGQQKWLAYEPLQILQKINVSESIWDTATGEVTLDWIPDMNSRDRFNMLTGNRTAFVTGKTHLYGGTSLWSRFDAATYILQHFVDEGGSTGPLWVVGGAANLLQDVQDVIVFGPSQTVADILNQIITPRIGVAWTVYPLLGGDQGFEVFVYSLFEKEYTFGGVTLQRNPGAVRIVASQEKENIQTTIVRTEDQRYGKIRVRGQRVVSCFTISATVGYANQDSKWSAALQTAYNAGTGTPSDEPGKHDEARRADRFRTVYQQWGTITNWNKRPAAPKITNDGMLIRNALNSNAQFSVRRTLPFLPIREGFDYSQNPVVDNNIPGHEGEFIPPQVWLEDPENPGHYIAADQAGMSMLVARNDWGFLLNASPNHLLAKNYLPSGISPPSKNKPKYDDQDMFATIAIETDQRLTLTVELPGGSVPSDGVIDIVDESAALWYLAPNTVVGVDPAGKLVTTPSNKELVVRNDASRLHLVMAGAIARYFERRARAEIIIKGLHAHSLLIGHILTVIETGGATIDISAPITSVEWTFERDPTTILRTGFAR